MKNTHIYWMISLVGLSLLSGCSGVKTRELERASTWDRREVVRIAFLPVEMENPAHQDVAAVLGRELYAEMSHVPEFHVVEPIVVEKIFENQGILENSKWKTVSKPELGRLLGVDLLLQPTLLRFGSTYLLVESTANVEIQVELFDAVTGEFLFKTQSSAQSSRGLSGIPTGLSSVALEPLRGLGKGAKIELTRALITHIVNSFDPTYAKPGEETGVLPPVIHRAEAIYTRQDNRLNVLIQADPDCRTTFYFTGLSGPQPCLESEAGIYRGGYVFPESILPIGLELKVRVIRRDGAAAERLIDVEQ